MSPYKLNPSLRRLNPWKILQPGIHGNLCLNRERNDWKFISVEERERGALTGSAGSEMGAAGRRSEAYSKLNLLREHRGGGGEVTTVHQYLR
ncbi:hypothetical protein J6590_056738 [Homalodisca vitripennis]|nr:hypothetical protein J6590_056738 [Homalodisca vitripennis]